MKAFRGKAGDPIKSAAPSIIAVPKAKKPQPSQSELFSGLSEPKKPTGRKRA